MMPHDDTNIADMLMGKIEGELIGYDKKTKQLTRGLFPAAIFVKILVPPGGNQTKMSEYSPYSKGDMERLKKDFPDLYDLLLERKAIVPIGIDSDGTFSLKLPLGMWSYVVCAMVGNKQYEHTGMPEISLGMKRPVSKEDFVNAKDMTIKDIIILAEDRWWTVTKGMKKGDPKTDPAKVRAGIVADSEDEDMDRFLADNPEEKLDE